MLTQLCTPPLPTFHGTATAFANGTFCDIVNVSTGVLGNPAAQGLWGICFTLFVLLGMLLCCKEGR